MIEVFLCSVSPYNFYSLEYLKFSLRPSKFINFIDYNFRILNFKNQIKLLHLTQKGKEFHELLEQKGKRDYILEVQVKLY